MEQFYGGEMDHGVAAVPGFDPMDREDDTVGVDHNLLDDDGPLSFYATDFPPVPDFPCMSSSSSSSSTRAPVKATSSSSPSSSSSAASWAVLKSDQDADRSPQLQQPAPPLPALSSTASMDMIPSENFMLEDAPRKEEEEVGLEDCLEMMETFGYMDLLECNDLFDPSSIFQNEEPTDPTATNNGYPVEEFQAQHYLPQEQPEQNLQQDEGAGAHHGHPASAVQTCEQQQQLPVVVVREAADEMGQVLLEWLRTNRDNISAEDLRRVKIKKATIESAAQRLGGGKAAMKQLLKLILEWVQTNHLHRKRKEAAEAQNNLTYSPFQDIPDPGSFPNPNPNILNPSTNNSFPSEPASCFPQSTQWPSPYGTEHAGSLMAAHPTFTPSTVGYMGGDLFSGSGDLYSVTPGLADYHMLDSPQSSWLLPQFGPASTHYNFMTADANFQPQASQAFVGYGNNSQYSNFQQQYYSSGNGERSLMRPGSSATKEARKKRMARQRRLMTHHRSGSGHHIGHHANHQNGHHQAVMAMDHQQHARALGGCDQVAAAAANPGNWVYFPAQTPAVAPPAPPPMLPPEAMQVHQPVERQPASMHGQCSQRGQVAPDRRQGWKPENNLKFLLQKVLKQSDVGNLGRIVLPKKEAETHLPELEARDGISISMEDIGTSRVWNMRYRFWPNNKSRMYLLENTGDFVRANGLQEGDFIVIYSDVKCGKYLIRGVKVRQTEAGAKSDPKRPDNSKPPRNSSLQGSSSTAASNAAQSK